MRRGECDYPSSLPRSKMERKKERKKKKLTLSFPIFFSLPRPLFSTNIFFILFNRQEQEKKEKKGYGKEFGDELTGKKNLSEIR